MLRRILLGVGLVLLVFALAGIALLPQSEYQRGLQVTTITLPDSLAPAAEPEPVVYTTSSGPEPLVASSSNWPVLGGVCAAAFAVALGSLVAAYLRPRGDSSSTPQNSSGRGVLLAGGVTALSMAALLAIVCLLGVCAVLGYLFFGQQLLDGPSGQGPSPNEMTNNFMMTQINYTQTASFLTQSAPTPVVEATPSVRPPHSGQPEPVEVGIEWPRQMEATGTALVRVWLDRSASRASAWDPQAPPYADPFGSDYLGMVDVVLGGDGFEISQDGNYSGRQSLDSNSAYWIWEIRPYPDTTGPRMLSATVTGMWRPVDGQPGQEIRRVLARPGMVVNVVDPAIPHETLNTLTLVGGLLGSLLCAPWLSEFIRRRIRRGDG